MYKYYNNLQDISDSDTIIAYDAAERLRYRYAVHRSLCFALIGAHLRGPAFNVKSPVLEPLCEKSTIILCANDMLLQYDA